MAAYKYLEGLPNSSFLVFSRDQIEYLVKQLTVPEEEGSALQLVDESLSLSGK